LAAAVTAASRDASSVRSAWPVTVIEMLPEIVRKLTTEHREDFAQASLARKTSRFITPGAKVLEITKDAVRFEKDASRNRSHATSCSFRQARLQRQRTRPRRLARGFRQCAGIKVDDRCATNVPGVWARAMHRQGMARAHRDAHGEVAVNNMTGRKRPLPYARMRIPASCTRRPKSRPSA